MGVGQGVRLVGEIAPYRPAFIAADRDRGWKKREHGPPLAAAHHGVPRLMQVRADGSAPLGRRGLFAAVHAMQSGLTIQNRNCTMTGVRFVLRVTMRRLDLAASPDILTAALAGSNPCP